MSKECVAKYVVSRKTHAQGTVTPIRKSTTSTSAPKMKNTQGSEVYAAKYVANRKIPAQGVVIPTKKI